MKNIITLTRVLWCGLALAAALLPSCGRNRDIRFEGIDAVKIGKIDRSGANVYLDLMFHNPNRAGARLTEAQGMVWLGDIPLGKFYLEQEVQIHGKAHFSVPVRLEANLKEMIRQSVQVLFLDSVLIKARGNARVLRGGVGKKIALSYAGKQATTALLEGLKIK